MVADHAQPRHLLRRELRARSGVTVQHPSLEVSPHPVRMPRQGVVQAAHAPDQGDQGRQFADRLPALVVVKMAVRPPDEQRGKARAVPAQLGQHVLDHGQRHRRTPRRLGEVDRQRLDRIPVLLKVALEVLRYPLGVLRHVAGPLGAQEGVQVVVVDGLLPVAADAVHQVDQRAGEDVGRLGDARLQGGLQGGFVRFGVAGRLGVGLHLVRVDGVEQVADDGGERLVGHLFDPRLVVRFKLVVEPGQPGSQRTGGVLGAVAHHQAHREILQRDRRLGVQRLAGCLQRPGDAYGIDDDVVGLGRGGRRHLPEFVRFQDAGAAPLHLFEVVTRLDIAHEQQAFDGLDVGAGGDHVHRDGDARVEVVAEGGEGGFRVLGAVGDLAAEVVALPELLAHRLDDVVGVAVGLGEDQRFGQLPASGEHSRPVVSKGADDGANLVRVHHRSIKLAGGVRRALLLHRPAAGVREPLPLLDGLLALQRCAALADLGLDQVDLVAHVDLVRHGLFVGVLADHVLLEEGVGAVVRRGGQADQEGVEVLDHLPPQVVDGAVALVNDDRIEVLRRQRGAVGDRLWPLAPPSSLLRMLLLRACRQVLTLERGVQALDGGDDHLHVAGNEARSQPLNVVELGELAVVVVGDEGHERLLGLLAQVAGVHQKEHAPGAGMLQQAVNHGDGGVGLPGAGGHLHEGAGTVRLQRRFETDDRLGLAVAQLRRVQRRQ